MRFKAEGLVHSASFRVMIPMKWTALQLTAAAV
jgi:hypothetical protein